MIDVGFDQSKLLMKKDDLFEPVDAEAELSENEENEEESNVNSKMKSKKSFIPQEFHKAKRNVNKLILQYFNSLKEEISQGAKLYLNPSKFQAIASAITYYVGLRYGDKKEGLDFKVKQVDDKKRQPKNGLFSYISENEKIINYSQDGKVNMITLQKGAVKLPDLATPVPFQNNIFLLDPCNYDPKRKVFVPSAPALMVQPDGRLKEIASPLHFRSKCALVKDKEWIYLLGGYATEGKILTNLCEKYNPLTNKYQNMPTMINKHHCPSACFVDKQIWVFSAACVEFLQKDEWVAVDLGWNIKFLPFQYVFPINQSEVLIFGGMNHQQKSSQVKLYNTREGSMINYGPILPQGICNQRSWGPCMVHGCIGFISSIQASVYPQVGVKSSMSQVIYVHENSAYLSCIIST